MVIKGGGIVIDLDLKHLDQFKTIEDYETSCQPTYFLKRLDQEPVFKEQVLEIKTEFYHLYQADLGKLQVQYLNNEMIGKILYQQDHVYLFSLKDNFETEYLLSQYAFVYWIRNNTNGLYIHCSSIRYENSGILFCAKSGTGKSTQRRLWERFGQAICINDDKNVLSNCDGMMQILPNPWSGKHFKNRNLITPVRAIVFLAQAKENKVEDLDKMQAFHLILNQIQLPSKSTKNQWNDNIDLLLSLPTVRLSCNMEEEAFIILEKELRKRGVFDEIKGK